MKKLGIFDTIETERCILKIAHTNEAEEMWNLIDETTTEFLPFEKGENHKYTLLNVANTIVNTIEGKSWDATIYLKETGKLIGRCGFNKYMDDEKRGEIGYWIAPEFYGQGIMPECVEGLLKYAFEEADFEKVMLRCDSKNNNSASVAIKCGLVLEGEFKKDENIRGKLIDNKYFGITKEEYFR